MDLEFEKLINESESVLKKIPMGKRFPHAKKDISDSDKDKLSDLYKKRDAIGVRNGSHEYNKYQKEIDKILGESSNQVDEAAKKIKTDTAAGAPQVNKKKAMKEFAKPDMDQAKFTIGKSRGLGIETWEITMRLPVSVDFLKATDQDMKINDFVSFGSEDPIEVLAMMANQELKNRTGVEFRRPSISTGDLKQQRAKGGMKTVSMSWEVVNPLMAYALGLDLTQWSGSAEVLDSAEVKKRLADAEQAAADALSLRKEIKAGSRPESDWPAFVDVQKQKGMSWEILKRDKLESVDEDKKKKLDSVYMKESSGSGWGNLSKGDVIRDIKSLNVGDLVLSLSSQYDAKNIIKITKASKDKPIVYGFFVNPKNTDQKRMESDKEFAIWDHDLDCEEYFKPVVSEVTTTANIASYPVPIGTVRDNKKLKEDGNLDTANESKSYDIYPKKLSESISGNTLNSYLGTALWSSNDESDESGGEPMDRNYDISDIAPETIEKAKKDLESFWEKAEAAHPGILDSYDDARIAHDFWLSRNRHGAGFFDGDYEKNPGDGEKLQDLAKSFREVNLYVGDDGMIYSD